MAAHGEPVVGASLRLPSEFSGRRPLGVTPRTGLEADVRPAQPRATTTIRPSVLDALIAPRVAMFSHRCRGRALGYRATRTPADGRALCLVSCYSEPAATDRDSKGRRPRPCGLQQLRLEDPAQVAPIPARCASKQVPSRSIAQATLSRRSATERRARACPWPRARSAWYLSWLTGSRWAATRAQW